MKTGQANTQAASPAAVYMREIGGLQVLRGEAQLEALRRYRETGDMDARRQVVESVLKLVVRIVIKKYSGMNSNYFMDLVQIGNEGIFKAIEKFDFENGAQFGTYVVWWVRAAISRHLSGGDFVRLPVGLKTNTIKFMKIAGHLRAQLGREPTHEEIAEKAEVEPRKVRYTLERPEQTFHPVSMDTHPVDDDKATYGDILSSGEETAEAQLITAQAASRLHSIVQEMKPRLKPVHLAILEKRLFTDDHPMTLQEIGEQVDLSRERIRQLETGLLKAIRAKIQDDESFSFVKQPRQHTIKGEPMDNRSDLGLAKKRPPANIGVSPEIEINDVYHWTIARGVHVEVRSNVELNPPLFEKLSKIMKLVGDGEPSKIVEVQPAPPTAVIKKNNKPAPKKTRMTRNYEAMIRTVLENTPPGEWLHASEMCARAITGKLWKDPPKARLSTMVSALKRVAKRADWLAMKQVNSKTFYCIKRPANAQQ